MRKLILHPFIAAVLLPAVLPAADAGNSPFVSGQKALYEMVSGAVVRAAEKMPEENYSFKPTPEVRSFGEIVGHAADAQMMFCSAANGSKPTGRTEGSKASKADLVEALKQSVAFCDKVYSGMTEAEAAQSVKFFGHDSLKLTILSFNTAHTDEHYGNMVTYLRLKNIIPPTSERQR
jgi:uncharacterized damage-inducible protein DinB